RPGMNIMSTKIAETMSHTVEAASKGVSAANTSAGISINRHNPNFLSISEGMVETPNAKRK
ncbi:hypothetical protein, partial [Escherichia coli]|uniref:hypothetical protein n=1 Tax=Escherichia coli TaxID=562 RepID=UPI001EDAFB37